MAPIHSFDWSAEAQQVTLTRSQFLCKLQLQQAHEDMTMLENMTKKSIKPKTQILASAMALLLTIGMTAVLQVKSAAQDQPSNEMQMEMKVPETAKDHHEMAEHYQKIEAQIRQEIEMHNKMLAEFKKTATENPKAGENP
jgi:flagellar biosynthesis/type III secretory pathway M-ring protein FliF/YscJ